MKSNIELLAPAGTYDAFLAAVENGANAVYMGGKLFNARANASNFDINELKQIVDYAHLRNVKIHITMNTLLDNSEIASALEFAREIYNIGVDAVIVQDLGLAKVLHENLPHLELHASTQLSTHNLEGVNELAKLGFSRVVLARELSIEEVKYICDNTSTEIEIFCHGALCVSYSGQCLMSSMIGDRSGNRGKCAQPCRLPYKLIKDNKEIGNGYLLSPKDVSTIDILKDLPNVVSLKIEGRMKSSEYVATVVGTYRKYLDKVIKNTDSIVSYEDKANLTQIFNRGGFSTGYLKGKLGKDTMCYEKPKNWGIYVGKVTDYDGQKYIKMDTVSSLSIGDGIEIWNGSNASPSTIISEIKKNKVGRIRGDIHIGDKVYKTSDKALNASARESYSRGYRVQTPVELTVEIKTNKEVIVKINDYTYMTNIIPEASMNRPLTHETIITQFSKTGNTPFKANNINVILDENLFLTVSTLNEIRRTAFQNYENYFLEKNKRKSIELTDLPSLEKYKNISKPNSNFRQNKKEISIFINTLKDEHLELSDMGINNFYFKFKDALNHKELVSKFNGKKYVILPSITKTNYARLIKENISTLTNIVDGFVISNIGQLEYLKDTSTELIANYTFNTFNTACVELLKNLGFSKIICSPELTEYQINTLGDVLPIEVIAYGNICVMTSEYCPIGSVEGGFCNNKKCSMPCVKNSTYYLRDRMNMDFRVIPDNIDCQSQIFNAKINSIETSSLNVNSIRIDVIDENINEIKHIIEIHKNGKKLSGEKYTNGHLNRPV